MGRSTITNYILQFCYQLDQKYNTEVQYKQVLSHIMRKLLKIPSQTFSIKWSNPPTKILNQIIYQTKNTPNFLKHNGTSIIHHMCDLIDQNQWKSVYNLNKAVDLNVIDQWGLWTKVSAYLDDVLKDVGKVNQEQVFIILEVLYQLRYQPNINQNPELFQSVRNILENVQTSKRIRIASYFLAYDPEIFVKYRLQMERVMSKQLAQTGSLSANNYSLFGFGSICNFWSKQFTNSTLKLIKSQLQTQKKMKSYKFIKYLQLSNPDIPTSIETHNFNLAPPSNTQTKVALMLADLGYIFDKNVYINGTEVDIYFDHCRLLVEFEGNKHYRINRNKGFIDLIKYVDWKRKALMDRGFVIVTLPFFEWNKLLSQKAQKLYLINRIQKLLMFNYKPQTK